MNMWITYNETTGYGWAFTSEAMCYYISMFANMTECIKNVPV